MKPRNVSFTEPSFTPLSTLSEQGNILLRRALFGSEGQSFSSASEFAAAFKDSALEKELPAAFFPGAITGRRVEDLKSAAGDVKESASGQRNSPPLIFILSLLGLILLAVVSFVVFESVFRPLILPPKGIAPQRSNSAPLPEVKKNVISTESTIPQAQALSRGAVPYAASVPLLTRSSNSTNGDGPAPTPTATPPANGMPVPATSPESVSMKLTPTADVPAPDRLLSPEDSRERVPRPESIHAGESDLSKVDVDAEKKPLIPLVTNPAASPDSEGILKPVDTPSPVPAVQ